MADNLIDYLPFGIPYIISGHSHSMVLMWFLLYIVDNEHSYHLYLLYYLNYIDFQRLFEVKMWSVFRCK